MNVVMPDGTEITDVPEGITQKELLKRYEASKKSPGQRQLDAMPSFVQSAVGLGEAGVQAATGLASSVVGGIAGLADTGLSLAGGGSGAPGDTVRKVQQFGTYQPRSGQGQAAARYLGLPWDVYTRAVHQGADAIRGGDSGGTRDFWGTTLGVAGESLPAGLGGMAALRAAGKATAPPLSRPQEILKSAQQEGYTVPPSLMGQRSVLEGAGGKARTAQLHSANNAEITAKIAARELGMPEGTVLSPELLSAYRKGAYDLGYVPLKQVNAPLIPDRTYLAEVLAPADQINRLAPSFPKRKVAGAEEVMALSDDLASATKITYEAAVERIRELRFDGKKNIKAYDDPGKSRLGHAQLEAAKSLEGLIERNLAKTNSTELLENFRHARQQIAKSHTVEEAMNPATGAVSARDLAKSKAPMTGGLKTAQEFGQAFPRAVQKTETFGGTPPFSPLDVSMGTLTGAMGAAATGSPAGLFAAGVPMLRPLAAPLTMGQRVQNSLVRNNPNVPLEVGLLPLLNDPNRRLR